MTCPSCSATLEDGAHFCGVCGHRLDPIVPLVVKSSENTRLATTSNERVSAIAAAAAMAGEIDRYIGTTLNGRFTVEEKLGQGGFGAVYKGVQLVTGRKVAIKLLHPEMTRDQNVVARFRREGQVLCSLRDAHTITTYDFDQTADGTLFIAMELLEGRSLQDVFREEAPIAWQRMLKIMSEMCSSLEEAHSLGIVHRDLKPENIHLEARPGNAEFVKILDFGIAKVLRGDGSSGIAGDMSPQLTATGQTLGTLEYMSPEQLMGRTLDGRSDIYGLGVVAFEMLTGRLPFPEAVGPAALISAQLKKTPPSASKVQPRRGIPPAVDQLILKMLAKDKNQRFRDVSELRREIEAILGGGGLDTSVRAEDTSPSLPPPPPSLPLTPSSAPASLPLSPGSLPSRLPSSAATPEQRRSWTGMPPAAPELSGPGPVALPPVLGSAPAGGFGHAGQTSALEPTSMTGQSGGPRQPARRQTGRQQAQAAIRRVSPGSSPVPDDHGDPPWASGRPVGSSISPGARLRASAGPVEAAPETSSRSRGGNASHTRWMWMTVVAILVLATVVGSVLALR